VLLCIAITSTLTQPVHADIKNIKVATFNVKLMPAFYDGWSSYQGEGLPRVDYVQRINVMTNIAKSTFRWETKVYAEADVVTEADIEAEAETRFGFDVIAYQEVWRNIIPYHVHFANIRDRLISIGFERENIVRGITSIERGWHHGLVIYNSNN